MTIKTIIALLKKDSWELICQNGSHKQFKHTTKKGRVTVPDHKGDLHIGIIESIEKQAQIKLDYEKKNNKERK